MITPSGTGSCAPSFDDGAAVVAHKPVRTGEPGATAAVGNIVSERMNERPAALTPVTILRTLPGIAGSPSRLLQGQLNEPVGPGLPIEIAARGDDLLELRRWDRQSRDDLADAPRFLGEVPDELAPGGLLRVALAVLREDRDPWPEERHLVRGDQGHALHQIEHLGRVVGAGRVDLCLQHGKAALHHAVGGVVRGAARFPLEILPPAGKRGARILRLEPVHDRLYTIDVFV